MARKRRNGKRKSKGVDERALIVYILAAIGLYLIVRGVVEMIVETFPEAKVPTTMVATGAVILIFATYVLKHRVKK